jgi:hypothetical protein
MCSYMRLLHVQLHFAPAPDDFEFSLTVTPKESPFALLIMYQEILLFVAIAHFYSHIVFCFRFLSIKRYGRQL